MSEQFISYLVFIPPMHLQGEEHLHSFHSPHHYDIKFLRENTQIHECVRFHGIFSNYYNGDHVLEIFIDIFFSLRKTSFLRIK